MGLEYYDWFQKFVSELYKNDRSIVVIYGMFDGLECVCVIQNVSFKLYHLHRMYHSKRNYHSKGGHSKGWGYHSKILSLSLDLILFLYLIYLKERCQTLSGLAGQGWGVRGCGDPDLRCRCIWTLSASMGEWSGLYCCVCVHKCRCWVGGPVLLLATMRLLSWSIERRWWWFWLL